MQESFLTTDLSSRPEIMIYVVLRRSLISLSKNIYLEALEKTANTMFPGLPRHF